MSVITLSKVQYPSIIFFFGGRANAADAVNSAIGALKSSSIQQDRILSRVGASVDIANTFASVNQMLQQVARDSIEAGEFEGRVAGISGVVQLLARLIES